MPCTALQALQRPSSPATLDSSYNSLPEGETYHMPPCDERLSEDDPFDTSAVSIQVTISASLHKASLPDQALQLPSPRSSGPVEEDQASDQALPELETMPSSSLQPPEQVQPRHHLFLPSPGHGQVPGGQLGPRFAGDGSAGPPSFIAQLLASQPSSAQGSPQPTPPPMGVQGAGQEAPRADQEHVKERQASEPRYSLQPPAGRHRRAVSTMADMRNMEAEGVLPPLTSPFSPPAFNPYDIVLGSNEAIAGLDSPAPRPHRQCTAVTAQTRDQAFSWLEDKIGDLKISKENQQQPDVFQFPPVGQDTPGVQQQSHLSQQIQQQHQQQQLQMQQQQQMMQQQNQQLLQQQQNEANRQQSEQKWQEEQRKQEQNLKKQQQKRLEEMQQEQQRVRKAHQEQQRIKQREQEQQMLQEQQQENVRLQQQQLQMQQLKQQKHVQEQQLQQQQLQHQMNLQQQQQVLRMQREKEMEQQNLAKIMQHKQQQQQRNATLQDQQRMASLQQDEVFHFPQASDLSTSPQAYSVDQQFVRGLEKDLGTSDAIANMLGPNPPPTPGIKVSWLQVTQYNWLHSTHC